MKSYVYVDYINNTLSCINLLPLDEQIRKYNTILDHFTSNRNQIYANKKLYKLF